MSPNYPRVFKEHEGYFEQVLIYNPQPVRGSPMQHSEVVNALKSTGAIHLPLSLSFHLITAALLEILLNEGHGELTIEIFPGKKGGQIAKIKVGSSHRVLITDKELNLGRQWSAQALNDLLLQHRHSAS